MNKPAPGKVPQQEKKHGVLKVLGVVSFAVKLVCLLLSTINVISILKELAIYHEMRRVANSHI